MFVIYNSDNLNLDDCNSDKRVSTLNYLLHLTINELIEYCILVIPHYLGTIHPIFIEYVFNRPMGKPYM